MANEPDTYLPTYKEKALNGEAIAEVEYREGNRGWYWRLRDHEKSLCWSTRRYQTEEGAERAFKRTQNALTVAVKTEAAKREVKAKRQYGLWLAGGFILGVTVANILA